MADNNESAAVDDASGELAVDNSLVIVGQAVPYAADGAGTSNAAINGEAAGDGKNSRKEKSKRSARKPDKSSISAPEPTKEKRVTRSQDAPPKPPAPPKPAPATSKPAPKVKKATAKRTVPTAAASLKIKVGGVNKVKAKAETAKPKASAKKDATAPAPNPKAKPAPAPTKVKAAPKKSKAAPKPKEAPKAKPAAAPRKRPAPSAEDQSIKEEAKKPSGRSTKAAARASLGADAPPPPAPPPQEVPPAKKQRQAPRASKAAPKKATTTALALPPPSLPPSDLFVFGSNPFGALGLGEDETVKYRPAQVTAEGMPLLTQVSCGGMHTAALDEQGRVWTWGVNDEGALGRCTEGTSWQEVDDADKASSAEPGLAFLSSSSSLPSSSAIKVVQVAAGDGFTFALTSDGKVYGCGMFKDDQGGLNGFSAEVKLQRTFALVYDPEDDAGRAVRIVAGARHMAALTAGHDVLTWGIASQGQLGRLPPFTAGDDGNQPKVEDAFTPRKVPLLSKALGGGKEGEDPVTGLGCGLYNTFAISESGRVIGWGLNNSGQMGLPKASEEANLIWEPTLIPSLSDIVDIRGGEQHTLALNRDGKVLTFGAATYGMLGREAGVDVTKASECHPLPTLVDGMEEGGRVTCIAAGMNVSACCTEDGSLLLWGSNVNYQLAKGEVEEDSLVPEKMKRTKTFGFRPVHYVSFGGQHGALLAGQPVPPPVPPPAAVEAATAVGHQP